MPGPRHSFELISAAAGSAADFRQRAELAARESAATRLTELESQSSPVRDPQERIQIWERLHALRLPRAPGHVLVKVIASQTRLTIGQVQEEQQRRAVGAGSTAVVP
jgi:hypothetical protein